MATSANVCDRTLGAGALSWDLGPARTGESNGKLDLHTRPKSDRGARPQLANRRLERSQCRSTTPPVGAGRSRGLYVRQCRARREQDGRWLAACSGREAYHWDLTSGRTSTNGPCLQDSSIAWCSTTRFPPLSVPLRDSGRETQPFQTDFHEHPHVGQLRDLLGPTSPEAHDDDHRIRETIDGAQFDPEVGSWLSSGSEASQVVRSESFRSTISHRGNGYGRAQQTGGIAFDPTSAVVVTREPVYDRGDLEIESGLPSEAPLTGDLQSARPGPGPGPSTAHMEFRFHFDHSPELGIWTDQSSGEIRLGSRVRPDGSLSPLGNVRGTSTSPISKGYRKELENPGSHVEGYAAGSFLSARFAAGKMSFDARDGCIVATVHTLAVISTARRRRRVPQQQPFRNELPRYHRSGLMHHASSLGEYELGTKLNGDSPCDDSWHP